MNANGYSINVGDWWVFSSLDLKFIGRVIALDGPKQNPVVLVSDDVIYTKCPNKLAFPVINPYSHNPDGLTVERVTGNYKWLCRLLDKDEIQPGQELEQIEVLSPAGPWRGGVVGNQHDCTYRTKLTRQELAAARAAAKAKAESKPKERKPLKPGVLRAGMAVRFDVEDGSLGEWVIVSIHPSYGVKLFEWPGWWQLSALAARKAHYHNGTDWMPCWTEE